MAKALVDTSFVNRQAGSKGRLTVKKIDYHPRQTGVHLFDEV
jgi:hypothetical protein